LGHCYGSPDGNGGGTTNVSVGYNKPEDPGYDDGNCTADRLQTFSLTASVESGRLDNATLRAILSGWRLLRSFRALTGPRRNRRDGHRSGSEQRSRHPTAEPDPRRPVWGSVQQPRERRHHLP